MFHSIHNIFLFNILFTIVWAAPISPHARFRGRDVDKSALPSTSLGFEDARVVLADYQWKKDNVMPPNPEGVAGGDESERTVGGPIVLAEGFESINARALARNRKVFLNAFVFSCLVSVVALVWVKLQILFMEFSMMTHAH